MTANELRIGNYANNKFWNPEPNNERWSYSEVKIIGVLNDTFYFTFRNDKRVIKTKELYGIPLTPEVLDKCGLTRHKCGMSGADMWQGMDGWSINDRFFSGWLFRGNGKELKLVGYYNSKIKYLHQLQNLYFALTGEELQYKP